MPINEYTYGRDFNSMHTILLIIAEKYKEAKNKKTKKTPNPHKKYPCINNVPFALHFRRGDLHLNSISTIPNTQGQNPLFKRTILISCN